MRGGDDLDFDYHHGKDVNSNETSQDISKVGDQNLSEGSKFNDLSNAT